jgi:hypothetical protein
MLKNVFPGFQDGAGGGGSETKAKRPMLKAIR